MILGVDCRLGQHGGRRGRADQDIAAAELRGADVED